MQNVEPILIPLFKQIAMYQHSILISLSWIIIGIILNKYSDIFFDLHKNSATKALSSKDDWFSEYVDIPIDGEAWVKEKVNIKKQFLKLRFKNKENNREYVYEGLASIQNEKYLSGCWKSTQGSAKGTFMLALERHNWYMYGYWTEDGDFAYWVLARKQDDIKKAKECLEKMILLVPEMKDVEKSS